MVAIIKPPLTEAQERQRLTWQYRAIERTRGNQTLLGCILIAIIGKAASNAPRIVGGAVIDKDGVIRAPFQAENSTSADIVPLCRVVELTRELNRLADVLGFSDDERKDLFSEARKWINSDDRTKPSDLGKPNLTEI